MKKPESSLIRELPESLLLDTAKIQLFHVSSVFSGNTGQTFLIIYLAIPFQTYVLVHAYVHIICNDITIVTYVMNKVFSSASNVTDLPTFVFKEVHM